MKARRLLSGAAYGPERLKLIYQAFDDAWAAIEPLVDNTPLAREAARLKLANMILAVAQDEAGAGEASKAKPKPPGGGAADKNSA